MGRCGWEGGDSDGKGTVMEGEDRDGEEEQGGERGE